MNIKILHPLAEIFFEFCFPSYCLVCERPGQSVCKTCRKSMVLAVQKCVVCTRKNPLGSTCRACLRKDVPRIALARFAYEGSAKELIHQYKYDDVTVLKNFFARELTILIKKIPNFRSYSIQSIPISRSKYRQRGFNQSELLARLISNNLKVPLTDSLIRVEVKTSQVSMRTKRARELNVEKAFKLKTKPSKKIILLDDVVTSGATMRQAAKVLFRAGCEEIICISIAR